MKTNPIQKTLAGFALVIVLFSSSISLADSQSTWFGEVADGQWLAGVKLGVAEPGTNGYRAAQTATAVVGYQFSRSIDGGGSSSVELEFGTSNDADIGLKAGLGVSGEWDIHTVGLFFNYRSAGTVYFKGKLGILDSNIISKFAVGNFESNDANFALGLGGGVRLGNHDTPINLEAEWVSSSGDHDINHFNIGLLAEF